MKITEQFEVKKKDKEKDLKEKRLSAWILTVKKVKEKNKKT